MKNKLEKTPSMVRFLCAARKILTTSEMRLVDGSIAVSGRGIYVEAPHLFKDAHFGK